MNIYDKISELREKKINAMLCTIVKSVGSTPRKQGSKMLVDGNGRIYGTIGGGKLELEVISKALDLIKTNANELLSYDLSKDLGMACGGSVEIFIEPISNKLKLFIFGAGHIGKALSNIMCKLDFEVNVIDDRPNIFNDWEPAANINVHSSNDEIFKIITTDKTSFIVIVTHSHETDIDVLKKFIKKEFAYCGMIGSKRKAAEIRKLFIDTKLATEEEFARIDLPIGLAIGAEGPDEIAISIAAKIIEVKSKLS